jgi:hypothetical protein
MRVLVVVAVKLVAVLAGLWALGQVLARRRAVGDETSDEFAIAAYMGGDQRTCRAEALRHGSVSVVCGGVDLDLRPARLDPAGADLELSATFGGVSLRVPRDWRVLVEDRAALGGVETRVTPSDELPDDAPVLRVQATSRLGGVSIRAGDAVDPDAPADRTLRGWAAT